MPPPPDDPPDDPPDVLLDDPPDEPSDTLPLIDFETDTDTDLDLLGDLLTLAEIDLLIDLDGEIGVDILGYLDESELEILIGNEIGVNMLADDDTLTLGLFDFPIRNDGGRVGEMDSFADGE